MCTNLDAVLRQAEKQVDDGADLFDVGGESTRPGAALVTPDVELERVVPVVDALRQRFDLPISVDTNKAGVAEAVLESGADFINDISGLTFDGEMATVVAQKKAGVFVMHTRGCPEDDAKQHRLSETCSAKSFILCATPLTWRARPGCPRNISVLIRGSALVSPLPAISNLLRRLDEVAALGYPVLIGTSRKSFIGKVLDQAGSTTAPVWLPGQRCGSRPEWRADLPGS